MKIHAALKLKNRLAGEVSRLQQIIVRENCLRSDMERKVNMDEVITKLHETQDSLITVKGAIQKANAGIAKELAMLAELKSTITWLGTIPVREGEEESYHRVEGDKVKTWSSFMSRARLDKQIEDTQAKINEIQDAIDAFNAVTDVVLE